MLTIGGWRASFKVLFVMRCKALKNALRGQPFAKNRLAFPESPSGSRLQQLPETAQPAPDAETIPWSNFPASRPDSLFSIPDLEPAHP